MSASYEADAQKMSHSLNRRIFKENNKPTDLI
jgi:hypothetical protein